MSDEKIIADDLIVLGNAVPDIISDQRITVCTVGFASHFGLIRIYPVPALSNMKRWNVVEVPLERNPKDTRQESWKLQGSKWEWNKLSAKIQLKGTITDRSEQRALLDKLHSMFGAQCVEEFNDKKVSLGMIRPQVVGYNLEKREDYESIAQTQLGWVTPFLTIKNYPLKPVIEYRCPNCKTKNPHKQQVVEWGVFEWMRRNPNAPEKVWENLHLMDAGYDRSFLVGNMALHRNSFMVISIFRPKLNA
jgi:hypothetical protein